MTNINRASITSAITQVDQASENIKKLTDISRKEIEEIAEKYSVAKSSTLAGIVGGIVGSVGGLSLATPLGAAIIATGPLGAALGAAVAILMWRGNSHWRIEKAEDRLEKGLKKIKLELSSLPDDVPPYVKDQLWQDYHELMILFSKIVKQSLGDVSIFEKVQEIHSIESEEINNKNTNSIIEHKN